MELNCQTCGEELSNEEIDKWHVDTRNMLGFIPGPFCNNCEMQKLHAEKEQNELR
jgi:hypothetical protein